MSVSISKTLHVVLLAVVAALGMASCHKEYAASDTMATVTLVSPDSVTVARMQGTVTLTNLNNRQSYSTSVFNGTVVQLPLLRGVYSVSAEGSVSYRDKAGVVHTGMFRATSSFEQLLDVPAHVSLSFIIL